MAACHEIRDTAWRLRTRITHKNPEYKAKQKRSSTERRRDAFTHIRWICDTHMQPQNKVPHPLVFTAKYAYLKTPISPYCVYM